MINLSLKVIHWLICITLWFAWIVPNKMYKKVSFGFVMFVMLTWLVFDRCIMWDIQAKLDPKFMPSDDYYVASKLNMTENTYKHMTGTIIYINFMMLGKQLGIGIPTLNMILIYGLFNGQYLHRGDDDITKYSKAPTLA